jgi:RNA polymerase sigma-70 factor, ECF subfamily
MHLNEKEIYFKYFEKVYQIIFYITKNEETTKDLTQDTFIKVFKNLSKVRNESNIQAWIVTIATRTAIDFYNKNKKQNIIEFIEDKFLSDTSTHWNEDKEELEDYLNLLKPEQKQILILKYIEELSEQEIAKLLKIKLGTVKSRLYRAKRKIADQYHLREDKNG